MHPVVKEELWRSIGVFALSLVVFAGLFSGKIISSSIFTVFIFPLLATFIIFLLLVGIRTKFSKGKALSILFVGLLLMNAGIFLLYTFDFEPNNFFLILLGLVTLVYGFIKLLRKNK